MTNLGHQTKFISYEVPDFAGVSVYLNQNKVVKVAVG